MHPSERITPEAAVRRGQLVVNGTVGAIMWGTPAVAGLTARVIGRDPWATAGLAFIFAWPLAWLSWSFTVPYWRRWAYRRVEDLQTLKELAVPGKLIWPDGHLFEKTEIIPASLRADLRALEEQHSKS